MSHDCTLSRSRIGQRARAEAARIQSEYPSYFSKIPVDANGLAQAFGYNLIYHDSLRERARLEYDSTKANGRATIFIKKDLSNGVQRFAIAHEIGHVLLLESAIDGDILANLDSRERFANTFAGELLIPLQARNDLLREFVSLRDPQELISFASRIGLSIDAVMSMAQDDHSCSTSSNRVWLRVKCVPNRHTDKDPRLRIVSACYDHERYYIPQNQSLASFAGSDTILNCVPVGTSISLENILIKLQMRVSSGRPKYRNAELKANLLALRLRPSRHDNAP